MASIFSIITLILFIIYFIDKIKPNSFIAKFKRKLLIRLSHRPRLLDNIQATKLIILGMAVAGSILWVIPYLVVFNWSRNMIPIVLWSIWLFILLALQVLVTTGNIHHFCKIIYRKYSKKAGRASNISPWTLTFSYMTNIIKHVCYEWALMMNIILICVEITMQIGLMSPEIMAWTIFVIVLDILIDLF